MTGNGYCEITIEGQKTGLKFNMYAFEQLQVIKGKEGGIRDTTALVWAGMLGNAYVKQTEPAFSFEQVSDWLEDQLFSNDQEGQLAKINEVVTAALARINKVKENSEPGEDAKKKILETV
jgi:hypothetical protein